MSAFGQTPPPPAADETVSVTLRNGTTLYGTVRNQNERVLVLRLDTPWKVDDRTIRIDDIASGPDPERAGARDGRREREWTSQGYRKVKTPSGVLWVQREQVELAKRARDMEAQLAPAVPAVPAVDTATSEAMATQTLPPPPAPTPSPWKRWGAEGALVLVALAVAGLAYKLVAGT